MSDTENQMGLFESGGLLPEKPLAAPAPPPQPEPRSRPVAKPAESPSPARREKPQKRTSAKGAQKKVPVKALSGLVPEGDVRLTANIRQDLHLKLKIASAYRRTTIGEIIEELVEKYV
jgi:outer membrane biosynthesis protein TonB